MSVPSAAHLTSQPSAWVFRWLGLLRPGSQVLDLACGFGRHARLAASLQHSVIAVDRDPEALATLAGMVGIHTLRADLEGEPWPFSGRRFDSIIVANYLHRPLLPRLLESLAGAGVLIYETFGRGNERFGKPSNPEFLLEPGELLEWVRGALRVIAYEDLYVDQPRPAMIQRICACGRDFEFGRRQR